MRKKVIGLATVYLGDSRKAQLPDGCADMIFTDPPYGHKNHDGDLIHFVNKGRRKTAGRPIANDDYKSADDLIRWLFGNAPRLLKHGGACCCCGGGGGPDPQFARWALLMDETMAFKQQVVWDKGRMGLGWHYRQSWESILVAQKRGGKCNWYDETRRVENIIRPGDYGIKKIIPKSTDHPTPKPPQLAAHFIKLHSKHGDTVLDPFMGGGQHRRRRRVNGAQVHRRGIRPAMV